MLPFLSCLRMRTAQAGQMKEDVLIPSGGNLQNDDLSSITTAQSPFHSNAGSTPIRSNLMSAIGNHTKEAQRKTFETDKKRKADKYGVRDGRSVLKKYKFDERANAAEKEGEAEMQAEEAMLQALDVPLTPSPPRHPRRLAQVQPHSNALPSSRSKTTYKKEASVQLHL